VADSSPGLLTILRSALERLSDESTVPTDDPAVTRFKQRILRSIAQLELERQSLKAPDVIVPESESQPAQPDSVIVLVARRPRKPGDDDTGSGHSSAA